MAAGQFWPDVFSSIAPAGYYVALRVGFAFPEEERNEFPDNWVAYYTQNGLMLQDPSVRWVYENTGFIRWRDLDMPDERGVLETARRFGLTHGAVVCCANPDVDAFRSYGTFARSDRDLNEAELKEIYSILQGLHNKVPPQTNLTAAELEALRLVKEGMRLKEIAYTIGVSEGAIKQRLNGAKKKLNARTNTQAASIAVEMRLI